MMIISVKTRPALALFEGLSRKGSLYPAVREEKAFRIRAAQERK